MVSPAARSAEPITMLIAKATLKRLMMRMKAAELARVAASSSKIEAS